jgi:predicted dehydrogenase
MIMESKATTYQGEPMRIGLVGYGTGGKNFHSPYIEAAVDCELVGIVARAQASVARARADWPETPVFQSLEAMLNSGVDAVTISTPPATRRDLVLEAIARGVHVVADKPFAPSAAAGLELARAADEAGVLLSVFHNRRWDADIRTLRRVLREQPIGDIWRFDSRFDQDDPATLERGPEGGLLRDLGSHLVDQALWLFGPAALVYANVDWIQENGVRTDAAFMIAITHRSGIRSYLSSSKVSGLVSRELRLMGSRGNYVSDQTDVQAQAVFAGRKPIDDLAGWGREAEARWGTLTIAGSSTMKVPSEQGAYQDFYTQFAAAARGDADQPVPAVEAIATLEVLDAARTSASETRIVLLGSS